MNTKPMRESGLPPVNRRQLAHALGVSVRRVGQLATEGVAVEVGPKLFDLAASVKRYIAATVAVEKERVRRASSALNERRVEALDRRAAIDDRDLISMDEAEATVEAMTAAFLGCLDAIPARMTKDPRERDRIRDFLDVERTRLSALFDEEARTLKTGEHP